MTKERNEQLGRLNSRDNASVESTVANRSDGANFVEAIGMHDRLEMTLPSEQTNENPGEDFVNFEGNAGTASDLVHTHAAAISGTLQGLPSERVMKKEVAHSLEKEIRVLRKEAGKMLLPFAKFDAAKYQVLVAKIRNLGHVLANLAFATYEAIKGLWLKHVKNQVVA